MVVDPYNFDFSGHIQNIGYNFYPLLRFEMILKQFIKAAFSLLFQLG